ncbi:MAG: hypothetical protein GY726_00620 [Proteobacteria bacterium]|nr:hypothetical protein [Pseudomonadota bacterium]
MKIKPTQISNSKLNKHFQVTGVLLASILMFSLGACTTTLGPQKIKADRFDYAKAVGDSWRTQTLLNIVKMRYYEWPLFMDVSQVITQYTQEHVGSVGADLRRPFGGTGGNSTFDIAKASYIGKYNERPTVIYTPVNGQRYAQTMLTPINPAIILGMVDAGWPADQVLRLVVSSINGFNNSHVSFGFQYRASQQFADFIRTLRKLQRHNALGVKIHISKRTVASAAPPAPAASSLEASAAAPAPATARVPTSVELIINRPLLDDGLIQELDQLMVAMGLEPGFDNYRIVYDDDKSSGDVIAFESRSIAQVMGELATYVEVPQSDIERGVVTELVPIPETNFSGLNHLMKIRSGPEEPTQAFAKVRYRNLWFWVDRKDHPSKRTFSFIAMLMNMVEPDIASQGPQIVTPVREDGMRPSSSDDDEEDEDGAEEES